MSDGRIRPDDRLLTRDQLGRLISLFVRPERDGPWDTQPDKWVACLGFRDEEPDVWQFLDRLTAVWVILRQAGIDPESIPVSVFVGERNPKDMPAVSVNDLESNGASRR